MIRACEAVCDRLLRKTDIIPRVAVTYSAQRKCELIELNNSRILIYDRNLGQALNTFNRIVFFGKSSTDGFRPLLLLLTDEALLLGRSDLALFLLAKSIKYAETWKLPHAISDPFVQTQTWLQELFIIAHEYCHLLMSADEEFRAQRARVGKIIWELPDEQSPAEIREGLLERYGTAPPIEDIAKHVQPPRDTALANQSALIEELGCDDFAFHVLAEYGSSVSLPPKDFFKATFLVLRHVRAINYARAFVRSVVEGADASGIDLRVQLLQVRQHRLRELFPAMLEIIKSKSTTAEFEDLSAESLQDQLSDLSDIHDLKIDNVFLFELFPKISQEFRDWKRRHKKSKQYDISQCRQVALARGWVIGLEHITCVTFPKGDGNARGLG